MHILSLFAPGSNRKMNDGVMNSDENRQTITILEEGSLGFEVVPLDYTHGTQCGVSLVKSGGQADKLGVQVHWVVEVVNKISVFHMRQTKAADILRESERPCVITFMLPSHVDHPQGTFYHEKFQKHTAKFLVKRKGWKYLGFDLKYQLDDLFHQSYMMVKKVHQNKPHKPVEGDKPIRAGYCLSGIGESFVFNVSKERIQELLENVARPFYMAFLSPNHPCHPYSRCKEYIPRNRIKSVYSKTPLDWRESRIVDLDRITRSHPEKLLCHDEDGFLPMHYAVYHGAPLDVVKSLAEKSPGSLHISNEDGDLALHIAAYWGREQLIPFLIEAFPDALVCKTRSGCLAHELAERSPFRNEKAAALLKPAQLGHHKRSQGFTKLEIPYGYDSGKYAETLHPALFGEANRQRDLKSPEDDEEDTKKATRNQRPDMVADGSGRLPIHKFLAQGADIETIKDAVEADERCLMFQDEGGDTPLAIAAYFGRSYAMPYLLARCPQSNAIMTKYTKRLPVDIAKSSPFSNEESIFMLSHPDDVIRKYNKENPPLNIST